MTAPSQLLELLGVFVFALSGGLLAVAKRLDLFAGTVLALFAALGGGVVRDVLVGHLPPRALTDWRLLAAAAVGGAVTFVAHPRLRRIRRAILVLDSAGLAAFAVTGSVVALRANVPPAGAALLGMTTAIGGGVLRDVLARELPSVLAQRELYAVPALAAATVVVVAWQLGAYSSWVGLGAATAAFLFRLLALHLRWRAPLARGVRPGERP